MSTTELEPICLGSALGKYLVLKSLVLNILKRATNSPEGVISVLWTTLPNKGLRATKPK